MGMFKEVDPDEVTEMKTGRRGRVSYPIMKSFLESGMVCAQLDRTGIDKTFMSLYTSLNMYVKNHELPVKVFSRDSEIYLMRLDLNADKTPNPNWKVELSAERDAIELTGEVVAKKYSEEKDNVTK